MNFIGKPKVFSTKDGREKIEISLSIGNKQIDNRTEYIPFDVIGNNMSIINDLKIAVGDMIEVEFELRGRKWVNPSTSEPKFYLSLECLKIIVI